MKLKSKKLNHKAQTVIELAFYALIFSGFFVTAYYLNSIFEVSQKQVQLLRTQAFMELGNFSDYGRASHGNDNPESRNSQVIFELGKPSEGTRVKIDQVEDFKKAVEGELEINVVRAKNEDSLWSRYHFPKMKTNVSWFDKSDTPLFSIDLEQRIGIAHNRSLDFKDTQSATSLPFEAIFNGSISFKNWIKAAQLPPGSGRGLIDNHAMLADTLRELTADDSELSDQAAKFLEQVDISNSIEGGAKASAINLALNYAMSVGLDKLGDLNAGAEGAGGAGGNVASTGGVPTDAASLASQTASGNLGSTAANVITQPVQQVASGLNQAVSGLSSGTLSGAVSGVAGLGQAVGTVNTLASAFGKGNAEVGKYAAIAQAPQAISSGLSGMKQGFSSQSAGGLANAGKVLGGAAQVGGGSMTIAAATSPELAGEMAPVVAGLQLASGAVDFATGIEKIGSEGFSKPKLDTLKSVGALASSAGTTLAAAGALTNNEDLMDAGVKLSLAGSAAVMTAGAAEMVKDAYNSEGGLINLPGHLVKENVDGFKETWKTNMDDAGKNWGEMNASLGAIMGPKKGSDVERSESSELLAGARELNSATNPEFLNSQGRTITPTNFAKAGENLSSIEGSTLLNMQYHGKSEEEIATMKENFSIAKEGMSHASSYYSDKENKVTLDLARIDRAKIAMDAIQQEQNQWMKDTPSAQSQLIAIRSGAGEASVERSAVAAGQTFEDVNKLEQEDLAARPYSVVRQFAGSDYTERVMDRQKEKVAELKTVGERSVTIASQDDYEKAEYKRMVRAAQLSESISPNAPIPTNDVAKTTAIAKKEADSLDRYVDETPELSSSNKERFRAAANRLRNLFDKQPAISVEDATRMIADQNPNTTCELEGGC